ncbi:MAG: 2-amino-4-hydroxy-6-hydroxymethyldihydropteridine diphosphokinase [Acidobacteria bacterium]|nr:2-amino-4-hydroxy-6-hydroxymethyldihydropteridine diphosphokinase [Acidobacteriota bacterium]
MPHASAQEWVVVGLGSNEGDSAAELELARRRLEQGGYRFTLASPPQRTRPVGGPAGQRDYLNQVLAAPLAAVAPGPRALLELALAIEREAGRDRARSVPWGPRRLDIDLLLYGARVIDEPGLKVPHPRLHQRAFVLDPLAGMLPDLVHPVLGRTIRELRAKLDSGSVLP